MTRTIAQRFYRRYFFGWKQYQTSGHINGGDGELLQRREDKIKAEIYETYSRKFEDEQTEFSLYIFKDGSGLAEQHEIVVYSRSQVRRWLPELKKDKTLEYGTQRGSWKNYAAYERRGR